MSSPISNRNFLSPTGFLFKINRCPKVSYFCSSANIPSLDIGTATQPTYLKDIPLPGDKVQFGDLNIEFLVDEDLGNYMEIQKWIRGLAYPDSIKEYKDLKNHKTLSDKSGIKGVYSDAVLQILTSNNVTNFQINFKDLFPVSLSTLTYNADETDINYFKASVNFVYLIYNITDERGNPL